MQRRQAAGFKHSRVVPSDSFTRALSSQGALESKLGLEGRKDRRGADGWCKGAQVKGLEVSKKPKNCHMEGWS